MLALQLFVQQLLLQLSNFVLQGSLVALLFVLEQSEPPLIVPALSGLFMRVLPLLCYHGLLPLTQLHVYQYLMFVLLKFWLEQFVYLGLC